MPILKLLEIDKSSICRFKLKKLLKLIDELQIKVKDSDDPDQIRRYQKKLLNLLEVKKQLAKDIGTVVVK